MKKKVIGLLCLLIIAMPLFAEMERAELQEMYLEFFRSRDIRAFIDPEGDIEFIYEGIYLDPTPFWITVYESDQQFFQIVKYGGYTLDTVLERSLAPIAATIATRWAPVAKVFVNDGGNNIIATAEALLVSPGDFVAVFDRLMEGLEIALLIFLENMP